MAVRSWLQSNLSPTELDALQTIHGPLTMFKRGEILALMPFRFLR